MIIKVGDDEYCLDGYANIDELQKTLLACYNKGREDREKEILKIVEDKSFYRGFETPPYEERVVRVDDIMNISHNN